MVVFSYIFYLLMKIVMWQMKRRVEHLSEMEVIPLQAVFAGRSLVCWDLVASLQVRSALLDDCSLCLNLDLLEPH